MEPMNEKRAREVVERGYGITGEEYGYRESKAFILSLEQGRREAMSEENGVKDGVPMENKGGECWTSSDVVIVSPFCTFHQKTLVACEIDQLKSSLQAAKEEIKEKEERVFFFRTQLEERESWLKNKEAELEAAKKEKQILSDAYESLKEALAAREQQNERYFKALNRLASWDEGKEVTGSFDCPDCASVAREALKPEGEK